MKRAKLITADFVSVLAYKSIEKDQALQLPVPSQKTLLLGSYSIHQAGEQLTQLTVDVNKAQDIYRQLKDKINEIDTIVEEFKANAETPDELTAQKLGMLSWEAEELLQKLQKLEAKI